MMLQQYYAAACTNMALVGKPVSMVWSSSVQRLDLQVERYLSNSGGLGAPGSISAKQLIRLIGEPAGAVTEARVEALSHCVGATFDANDELWLDWHGSLSLIFCVVSVFSVFLSTRVSLLPVGGRLCVASYRLASLSGGSPMSDSLSHREWAQGG